MSKFTDDLKAIKKGAVQHADIMLIEQRLNKIFYDTPDYTKEYKMFKMQKQQEQQRGDRCGLHCSAILASDSEFCYREQVLSLFYKQNQGSNVPLNLKRIFAQGSYIGEKWQRLFVSAGIGEIENMDISRFVEKYDLSYTPDARVNISNKNWVVEIKSMNTFQFKHATSHPSGKKQLRMYMYFEKIKNGFVLVEDKNDQNFKVFPEIYGETFTKEDIQPYLTRLDVIQDYKNTFIENKKMPERICRSVSDKRAVPCNMRDACFNCGIGRVPLKCTKQ